MTIPKSGYTNTIDFVYDADGRRIKKVYDRGFICQCGPEESPPLTPPDGAVEGLLPPPDRDPGTLQPLSDSGAPGVIAPGPASAASEGPGPGEECICRSVTVTHYLYTHDGRLLREYVNGIGQRDFIHAGEKKIAVYEHNGIYNGKLHYFLTDHLGSTRVIVDSTGAIKSWFDYHPYGTLRASQVTTVDTKHRYTGKEHDGDDILNQDYFGARYLHGNTLRFTAVDPQASRYPGWSPYCYALGDPMRLVDPDGEFVLLAFIAAAAAVGVHQFVYTANTANAPESETSPVVFGRTLAQDAVDGAVAGAIGMGVYNVLTGTAPIPIPNSESSSESDQSTPGAENSNKSKEPTDLVRGKRAHSEMPDRPGEQREVRTPSGKRMDRYDPTTGHIREIKPNNPRAMKQGEKQVDGYRKEMEDATGKPHSTEVTPYDPRDFEEPKK